MQFKKEAKNYLIAVIILILSLSYIIFYSNFEGNYESIAVNAIVGQPDGTRVLVEGVVSDVAENGFYICEYENCIKATGDYEGIIYPGDKVTVCGTIDSYKGHKFIRINRLTYN